MRPASDPGQVMLNVHADGREIFDAESASPHKHIRAAIKTAGTQRTGCSDVATTRSSDFVSNFGGLSR